jgi:hypothetical protein
MDESTSAFASFDSIVRTMALSPDGRTLAIADNITAALWDVTDRTHPIRTAILTSHT